MSSGSDQSRSHIAPSCGTSCLRSMVRICKHGKGEWHHQQAYLHARNDDAQGQAVQGTSCQLPTWSNVEMVGDRPPWTQKIRLSMTADKLRGEPAVAKTTKSALSSQGIKELHPCGLTHAP